MNIPELIGQIREFLRNHQWDYTNNGPLRIGIMLPTRCTDYSQDVAASDEHLHAIINKDPYTGVLTFKYGELAGAVWDD